VSNLALFDLEEPPHSEGRDDLDRYYTPEWATQALVDYLGERLRGGVWDPCCGKDWGGRVIRKARGVKTYLGTDIDPSADIGFWRKGEYEKLNPCDFLSKHSGWGFLLSSSGWIVTNPPYRTGRFTATDFVRHAITGETSTGRSSVAMLLRLTWLEPCADRVDILTEDPPTDVLILPRVNFIGAPGSNPCTSAWVIWDRNNKGSRISWGSK